MDIKKLKYDLAMQCTLAELLKEQSIIKGTQNYDIRVSALEHFDSYYAYFNALDISRFKHLEEL